MEWLRQDATLRPLWCHERDARAPGAVGWQVLPRVSRRGGVDQREAGVRALRRDGEGSVIRKLLLFLRDLALSCLIALLLLVVLLVVMLSRSMP